MRIIDWSSDVCSSDLAFCGVRPPLRELQWKQAETTFSQMSRPPCDSGSTWSRVSCWRLQSRPQYRHRCWSRANSAVLVSAGVGSSACARAWTRSEEHTSELQSLMRNSYAVCCL